MLQLAALQAVQLAPARFPDDLDVVGDLFREYAQSLGIDLSFQSFDAELAGLPGVYAPPAGRLLLARDDAGAALGCVALRKVPELPDTCEMKRLYLRPVARGTGLGRRLAQAICAEARAAGYQHIVLDTLPSMQAAVSMYRALGFRPVDPYVFNPIPGALFLGLQLDPESTD